MTAIYDPLRRCTKHDEENCIECATALILKLEEERVGLMDRFAELIAQAKKAEKTAESAELRLKNTKDQLCKAMRMGDDHSLKFVTDACALMVEGSWNDSETIEKLKKEVGDWKERWKVAGEALYNQAKDEE